MYPEKRWTDQLVLSEKLGQPLPAFTLGLEACVAAEQFPQILDSSQPYCKELLPIKDVLTPVLTVEVTGPGGTLEETVLQTRHNGACMLNNFTTLKKAAGLRVRSYRDKIQALTF